MNTKKTTSLTPLIFTLLIVFSLLLTACGGGGSKVKTPGGESRTSAPSGDMVEVSVSWTQIRSSPSEEGRAIALAYGNDPLEALEERNGWVKVRFGGGRVGWVKESDIK